MSTRIGDSLRDLGDAVDAIVDAGGSVTTVETRGGDERSDGQVELGLRVQLPLLTQGDTECFDFDVEDGAIVDDGSLAVTLVASSVDDEDVSAEDRDESPAGDGAGDPEGRSEDESSTDDGRNGDDGGSDPGSESDEARSVAYKDPERLRAVYDAYESFPAMTEALGVDVTPQTVRRHMIEHGIHEPGSGAPSGDADGSEPDTDEEGEGRSREPGVDGGDGDQTEWGRNGVETEGRSDAAHASAPRSEDDGTPTQLGELDGVDVDDLKEAVRSSRTIHEVGQRLGVPREQAFRLLNTLDLVDLVSGRLETADRPISGEELDQRIARAAAE